jgi:pyruvate dehydrogenase E2 component (dihydrolipoamide acetyltransferase)
MLSGSPSNWQRIEGESSMPTNVIMPQMGESIFEGTVTKWLKKVGDLVKRDEPLFEISTDKVDSEIPAPASGVLSDIRVKEGETVQINTVVAVIDEPEREQPATSIKESKIPDIPKPPETKVSEPETSEAQSFGPERSETPSFGAGRTETPNFKSERSETLFPVRSSPLVRRIAKEEGVDLSELEGTGLGGRITKKDILGYLAERQNVAEVAGPIVKQATEAMEATRQTTAGRTEVVPMSAMRKSIAEHMIASRRISAHVTTVFEVDMTRIVNLRNQNAQEFLNREGFKLSYMPFFIKVTAEALKEFPTLNASITDTNIVYKKDINVGVAVALDWGLIVPVIKNADEKSFLGLARTSVDLAERARRKKLTPEDVQNGTFTITNPGVLGSLLGTPIINQPQVAILCIGAITKRPVVINDAIGIRSMVFLTLTFDHRLIDGAVADQFMASIKGRLESWEERLY